MCIFWCNRYQWQWGTVPYNPPATVLYFTYCFYINFNASAFHVNFTVNFYTVVYTHRQTTPHFTVYVDNYFPRAITECILLIPQRLDNGSLQYDPCIIGKIFCRQYCNKLSLPFCA